MEERRIDYPPGYQIPGGRKKTRRRVNLGVGVVSHVSASSSSSHPLLVPGVTRGLLLVEDGMKGWQRRRRIGRLCVPPPTERLLVCPPPPSKERERERDGR